MNIRRLALLSGSLAAITGLVIAAPVVAQALRESAAREEAARYASGLSPCEPGALQPQDVAPALPQSKNSITVLRLPAFSKPSAVQIVAGRAEHVELEWVQARTGVGGHFAASKRSSAEIGHQLAQRVAAVLAADVSHAAAPIPLGLDGTTYYFYVAGVGCGSTWSPRADSRAGWLVDLAGALSKYAARGGGDRSPVESAVDVLESH